MPSGQLHSQTNEMPRRQLGKEKMADADLDVVIRQLAKQQYKGLMAAAKKRRDRYAGLAAKAKNGEAKAKLKLIAKNTMEQATAAARRLQISADNAADSYARSMRNAAEAPPAKQPVAKPVKKAAKKATKKTKA
jgi:hypothetical protein